MTDDDIKKGAFVENYDPANYSDGKSTGLSYISIMKKHDPKHEDISRDVFRNSYIGNLSTRVNKWSEKYRANVYELTKDHALWDQATIDGVLDDATIVYNCVQEIVDTYQGTLSVEHRVLRLLPKKQRRKLLKKWRTGEES